MDPARKSTPRQCFKTASPGCLCPMNTQCNSRITRKLRGNIGTDTHEFFGGRQELRATHDCCFLLQHMVKASSNNAVTTRTPATEPAPMMMFLWRNCRSCSHGTVLSGIPK